MRVYRDVLQVKTSGEFDVIDVTADVEKAVLTSAVEEGYALIYSRHTTFAVLLNEKESGLLVDASRLLRGLVPEGNGYLHDDLDIRTENLQPDELPNAHAHLRQILAGRNSEYIPVADGVLTLGTWQRIMLVEFDRPRDREVVVQVCGVGRER
ncbi:MAG TPA: secondary thiamine-phosphate synthase enzyme YjbQ [Egibacteraceae bacterium]|nr:secondary thiamine-phosphate synthase enzyme YjbQ [Egibacteraceae bacterium]